MYMLYNGRHRNAEHRPELSYPSLFILRSSGVSIWGSDYRLWSHIELEIKH